jgi:uncharacterized lipoprotein
MIRMTTSLRRSLTLAVLPALAVLALSGCAEVKRSLGYEKSAPDEFQVVERAPLAMPPDFALRPPSPGAVRPQEGNTREQARQALVGNARQVTPVSTQGRSSGDVALLKKAGAENIQPNIRVLVNKETQAIADTESSFTDKLVFWQKAPTPGSGEQLDAAKEAQRLRQNQALGSPVTQGETPRIQRKRRGVLEGVFD